MSVKHVDERWKLYRYLTKIMHASLNGEIILNSEDSPVPDFPKKISEWEEWAFGVAFLVSLGDMTELTDEVLKTTIAAFTANHKIASAVMVDAPDTAVINSLIDGLNDLNEVIKEDERFHAALAIGTAIAQEIERRRELA